MKIEILPSVASGTVRVPPSKSYMHRYLICAALTNSITHLSNIAENDDIKATIGCLEKLGAVIEKNGSDVTVRGINYNSPIQKKEQVNLFCNESGSTLRFLIPLGLLFANEANFTGSGELMNRPQSVYGELLGEKGCSFKFDGKTISVSGDLHSGRYSLPGNISSQFITGLLFTLPLLEGDSEIILTTPLESEPYVDVTLDALSQFGVSVQKNVSDFKGGKTDCENSGTSSFIIKGSQNYKPKDIYVEGDWSSAAFLEAFNLLGGNVTVTGLRENSCQGDKCYREFYRCFADEKQSAFSKQPKVVPIFDISDCPDLGPVLIAVCALKGGGVLTGTKRLKIKESDRAQTMKTELAKFGVDITVNDNEVIVPKTELHKPSEMLCAHNDHRIAMSLAVMCSKTGGVIDGVQCVKKSYPDFFEDIQKSGIDIKVL